MASLTLTIDEELLRQARIRALELGTSVNALVRDYLESFTDPDRQQLATDEIIALAERTDANTGPRSLEVAPRRPFRGAPGAAWSIRASSTPTCSCTPWTGPGPAKQRRAKEVLRSTPGITVSTQVLNEYYVAATRKLKPPVPPGSPVP